MATIDLFSYNGEEDLLELRLNCLDSFVDQFIICEAGTTFSRFPKELYYPKQKDRFKKWEHKIKYYEIKDNYTYEEVIEAYDSKYTDKQPRWMHEYLQKEDIKHALPELKDDDVVYIGDVDEIWEPRTVNGIEKLKLHVYTYYFNQSSTEEFWGPIRAFYGDIKGKCFNDLRNNIEYRTTDYQGCHFTNIGGYEQVMRKWTDQYIYVGYAGEPIKQIVERNYGIRDVLGRDFKLEVNESNWPQYLKDNKDKYNAFIK